MIDQLDVVNLKMWNAQENLYEVRRMSFDEFKAKFFNDENFIKLYEYFKKACDLNVQRNDIIDEIDSWALGLIHKLQNNITIEDSEILRKKYKTY